MLMTMNRAHMYDPWEQQFSVSVSELWAWFPLVYMYLILFCQNGETTVKNPTSDTGA